MVTSLYHLADEGRMRKAADSFGVRKSTISKIIRRVIQVISKYLGGKYNILPTNEKVIEEIASSFYNFHVSVQ